MTQLRRLLFILMIFAVGVLISSNKNLSDTVTQNFKINNQKYNQALNYNKSSSKIQFAHNDIWFAFGAIMMIGIYLITKKANKNTIIGTTISSN
jgi:multisubunit Na+/H+ antiporter MnhC subunit